MASISVAGDTSGSITIAAPNVAGTNTLTLPAATGTVIYSDASANIQFNSGYGSVATAYGCRAWVKFNGTGTVAINGSGNVSSITDNGTGDYTINFTNAMPDTNYAFVFGGTDILNGQSAGFYASQGSRITSPATGSVRIFTFYTNSGSAGDQVINNVAIFR